MIVLLFCCSQFSFESGRTYPCVQIFVHLFRFALDDIFVITNCAQPLRPMWSPYLVVLYTVLNIVRTILLK